MRRSIVAAAACLGLTLSVLALASPTVAEGSGRSVSTDVVATQALGAARAAFGAEPAAARRTARAARPDATLALRDLFMALPRLDADQRQQAQSLLARPTDGGSDPLGDGYAVQGRRKCKLNICLHWVPSTADAPPSQAWVKENLTFMNKVWRAEVDGLGYRKPVTDGSRGGNGKFDVYLKELGSRGLYGYCTPERRAHGQKWLASGYCVLDNDFAEAQYGAPPRESLRVTAAHEFFHAVQFAYDYGEDPWLMEASATWMEERVADSVNDNRQYLPYGQVGAPAQPLDQFDQQGFNQYGNWSFVEYLSSRYGNGIVRSIWTRAGEYDGAGHQYSTNAVKDALGKRGGFTNVYRSFAAGNVVSSRTYAEGGKWPSAPATSAWTLSQDAARHDANVRVNHMASRNVVVRPAAALKDKRWKLEVRIDGPAGATSPAASLVVRTKHGVNKRVINLSGEGKGGTRIGFTSKNVLSATVVLVNASTRFSCWHETTSTCQGRAKDNKQRFTVHTSLHRAKSRDRS
jgi:hypothetical protein